MVPWQCTYHLLRTLPHLYLWRLEHSLPSTVPPVHSYIEAKSWMCDVKGDGQYFTHLARRQPRLLSVLLYDMT